jgi:hypothetical protein
MGAFSPGAFRRMVKYANGWIGMIYGSLENFENTVKVVRDMANQEKVKEDEESKNGSEFKVILLTYPKVINDKEEMESNLSKKE